jgi:hypothetical protein
MSSRSFAPLPSERDETRRAVPMNDILARSEFLRCQKSVAHLIQNVDTSLA